MAKPTAPATASTPALALRRTEAAKALSISIRLLDVMTADGTIPYVRLGTRVVLYPVAALEAWLAAQAAKAVEP